MFLLVLKALARTLDLSNLKFIPSDIKYFNIHQQCPESDNTSVSPILQQCPESIISHFWKKLWGRNARVYELKCQYLSADTLSEFV